MIFPNANLLAIDPGVSGGLAFYQARSRTVQLAAMPATERGILELIGLLKRLGPVQMAALERVGGFIGKNQPGHAMFKFGQNYGILKAALLAHEIPFDLVTPQKWQKTFQLGRKADHPSDYAWKTHLRARAEMLFPRHKITNATADAALMLAWLAREFQPQPVDQEGYNGR